MKLTIPPWGYGWTLDASGNLVIGTYWWLDNTLQPGVHSLVADYLGDTTCAPSTASMNFTIAPIGTQTAPIGFETPSGTTVSLSNGWGGSVSIPGYVNGFVDMSVDGNPWWSGGLYHQGNDTSLTWISIGSGDGALFPPGMTHTIRAHFRGNANYAPTDADLVVTVTP